jgi:retron-type reverse transcriptase
VTWAKPFDIPKREVWEAFKKVKANQGTAGVDGPSVAEFEARLGDNLYKLWNRLSSGSYFPAPVRRVDIPKASGGTRPLGIPTVADRVAQEVVRRYLEPRLEPLFHADSYGYRPGRSAIDAVRTARRRCWRNDWVLDIDIKGFFDSIDHDLLLRALRRHADAPWVLLYVERWLRAPMQREDGSLEPRNAGTPQGGVISPILANLFLHYAFDAWMMRTHPTVPFERYADDVRHITRRWIPFAERRGLEDMPPGPTAYPAAKVKGDRSMPSKRERSEDADDPVPQGPRDTVRTELFEPQPPTMQAYIPRHSVLRRGHRDRATKSSSLEPSTRWAMGHRPIQGGERGTSVALDTSSTTGMWDRPTRREAQGDGAAVVLRGRESRPHGEGR